MSSNESIFSDFSLFSKDSQLQLKANCKKLFNENFQELASELQEEYFISFTSAEFETIICEVFEEREPFSYGPLEIQFLHLVENFLFLAFLHSDHEEFDILDFWQDTIFNQVFMELYQQKKEEVEVSVKLSHILENQILSFYYLHLNMTPLDQKGTLLYPISYELGDFEQRVYIGNDNKFISFNNSDNNIETFPNIPIHYVPPHRKFIEVDYGTKVISKNISQDSKIINNDKLILSLHPSSNEFILEFKNISKKITNALSIIENYSPDCFLTFSHFTSTIVPISEPGIVSYSSEHLPGYSSINLMERDFVDLIDDLIHENGHHYLNHALSLYDLIIEDDEAIFYSPWRKSLRPIRGIYHAAFTFFFAAKLFSDLSMSLIANQQKYNFSNSEREKIYYRFLEEFIMLTFSRQYISWGHQHKKVTDQGHDLISCIYKELDLLSKNVGKVELALQNINQSKFDQLQILKSELDDKASHYSLD